VASARSLVSLCCVSSSLGCIDMYRRPALLEKIGPDEAEPEGCGGPIVESENEA